MAKASRVLPTRRGLARIAVSTGEAGRFCLVSPDTIANWIAAGQLPAQRTAGRQFRIRVDDLRSFMVSLGMRTDLLDAEYSEVAPCWEYWTRDSSDEATACVCRECPVRRSKAMVCSEIRPLLPGGTRRAPLCSQCEFHRLQSNKIKE